MTKAAGDAASEAGRLLSEPSGEPETYTRSAADFTNHSERFVLPQGRTFQRQYAHIYASRLFNMRPKLEESAKKKWSKWKMFKLIPLE